MDSEYNKENAYSFCLLDFGWRNNADWVEHNLWIVDRYGIKYTLFFVSSSILIYVNLLLEWNFYSIYQWYRKNTITSSIEHITYSFDVAIK